MKELIHHLGAPSSLIKAVHSGVPGHRRNEILQSFKHNDIRILIATDVGAKRL